MSTLDTNPTTVTPLLEAFAARVSDADIFTREGRLRATTFIDVHADGTTSIALAKRVD